MVTDSGTAMVTYEGFEEQDEVRYQRKLGGRGAVDIIDPLAALLDHFVLCLANLLFSELRSTSASYLALCLARLVLGIGAESRISISQNPKIMAQICETRLFRFHKREIRFMDLSHNFRNQIGYLWNRNHSSS
jgi:hypothetical protein